MKRKIPVLFLYFCFLEFVLFAQPPQRPANKPVEPSRMSTVLFNISGGSAIPFSNIASSQSAGGFGQAGISVFIRENIVLGADYAYHFFPGKDNYMNISMHEVLIYGSFYFRSSWNPDFSFGLGYYGEPGTSHLGIVPGIGIMPKITEHIYFNARASVAFLNIDGHFFKIGAGLTFKLAQFDPKKQ